jgi:hypothetical protein
MCQNGLVSQPTLAYDDGVISLECRTGGDGVIYLAVGGRVTNTKIDEFTKWTDCVRARIAEAAVVRAPKPVLVYSDASRVRHFERKSIAALRALLDEDKKYAVRSVIVGASGTLRVLLDAIIRLTGRANLRQFGEREEALQWLLVEQPLTPEDVGSPREGGYAGMIALLLGAALIAGAFFVGHGAFQSETSLPVGGPLDAGSGYASTSSIQEAIAARDSARDSGESLEAHEKDIRAALSE